MDWSVIFNESHSYDEFLTKYATPEQLKRWSAMHDRVRISPDQALLLGSFVRKMPVVVLNGAWCGDCINQCPIFDHFAMTSNGAVEIRYLDRDANEEAKSYLAINGGNRVPIVVFLSEDFQEVARYGDRTISRYRKLAIDQLGPTCPTGIVPPEDSETAEVVKEWLAEFERAQLILRLSPRLRQKHGD